MLLFSYHRVTVLLPLFVTLLLCSCVAISLWCFYSVLVYAVLQCCFTSSGGITMLLFFVSSCYCVAPSVCYSVNLQLCRDIPLVLLICVGICCDAMLLHCRFILYLPGVFAGFVCCSFSHNCSIAVSLYLRLGCDWLTLCCLIGFLLCCWFCFVCCFL